MEQPREVQSVEGMARTVRLGLLARTIVAMGNDLPDTSWTLRHAAWLLSHFQAGTADGKTAKARQFEKNPTTHLCYYFAERVMWKDLAVHPAKLRSSWGCMVCGWDDHRQAMLTSLARDWASLWLARFDVCRHQNATSQVWWGPCWAHTWPDGQRKRQLAMHPPGPGTLWSEQK